MFPFLYITFLILLLLIYHFLLWHLHLFFFYNVFLLLHHHFLFCSHSFLLFSYMHATLPTFPSFMLYILHISFLFLFLSFPFFSCTVSYLSFPNSICLIYLSMLWNFSSVQLHPLHSFLLYFLCTNTFVSTLFFLPSPLVPPLLWT